MKPWISRTQVSQRPSLAVYAGLLVAIMIVIVAFVLGWLSSASADRLAVIGNFLSLGTLLLALVAGIVALIAYSAATGLPDLKMQFVLPEAHPNEVRFIFNNSPDEPPLANGAQAVASIVVDNTSKYAARTPAVIIEFRGAEIQTGMYASSGAWTPIRHHPGGGDIRAVQWDGGPNFSIHGNSPRHLPDLNLQGLRPDGTGTRPEAAFRLLADGYDRPPIVRPIEFSAAPELPPYDRTAPQSGCDQGCGGL